MRNIKKNKHVRISAPGVLAGLLLAYAGIHGVPGAVARDGAQMLANAVGASASVPTTPENTIAAQLAARETDLSEREQIVSDREKAQVLRERDILPRLSFFASIALFLLVGVNFFFDWRSRRPRRARPIIDLSRR